MKKHHFKRNLIILFIPIIAFICIAAYFKIKNLQPNPDFTEFIAYNDYSDYIEAIKQDPNISPDRLDFLVEQAQANPSHHYGLITHHLQVTKKYTTQLYVYIQFEYDQDEQRPSKITSLEYGNMQRQDGELIKQFTGELSYSLNLTDQAPYYYLFWHLKGKFINSGTTIENITYQDSSHLPDIDYEGITIHYTIEEEGNYYQYLDKEGNLCFPN